MSLLEKEVYAEDDAPALLLPPFLHAAAQALLPRASQGGSSWHEPLLRGLRFLCLESPLARATLPRALVGTSAAGLESETTPLAALVRLAVGDHAPTASEAVGLLAACLPPVLDERDGEGAAAGLWPALTAVMLGRGGDRGPPTAIPSSPARHYHKPATATTPPPSAATAQLNQSPARRAAAMAAAARQRSGGGASLLLSPLERLAGVIAALGDEVEVATAGPDGLLRPPTAAATKGGDVGGNGERLALLEVEWRLRALLRLAFLLAHAPAEGLRPLVRAVAEALSPRALAAIVLGLAHASCGEPPPQRGGPPVMDAWGSANGRVTRPAAEPFFLGPRAVEPLEIIVAGCRLLLLPCVQGAGGASAGETEEEKGLGKGESRAHARWRSVVLAESKEVAAALYVAWSQGASRALLEEVGFFGWLCHSL